MDAKEARALTDKNLLEVYEKMCESLLLRIVEQAILGGSAVQESVPLNIMDSLKLFFIEKGYKVTKIIHDSNIYRPNCLRIEW